MKLHLKFLIFLSSVFIFVGFAFGVSAQIEPRGRAPEPIAQNQDILPDLGSSSSTSPGLTPITVNLQATVTPPEIKTPPRAPKKVVATKPPAVEAPVVYPTIASSTPDDEKNIVISLKDQTLAYFQGTQLVGEFKISSGIKSMPTPPGDYTVLEKKPLVDFKGPGYNFPNTKWNLLFKKGDPLGYYIHGAYWHHNFGHPMSHGCINVSYANMEPLYNWADVGTKIEIE